MEALQERRACMGVRFRCNTTAAAVIALFPRAIGNFGECENFLFALRLAVVRAVSSRA